MFEHTNSKPEDPDITPYTKLIRKLGETFVVRDVMVQLPQIEYVGPGEEAGASQLVGEKRYSVVPVSDDGKTFNSVFCTVHEANDPRRITREQQTSISDHIPDSTPLADAFSLFDSPPSFHGSRDFTSHFLRPNESEFYDANQQFAQTLREIHSLRPTSFKRNPPLDLAQLGQILTPVVAAPPDAA